MTAGLQIFNASGVIQIDENKKNPRLVATGSVARYTGSQYTFTPHFIDLAILGLDVTLEMPIILVRPTTLGGYVGGTYVSANYGRFEIDNSGTAFDYAIFSTQGVAITDAGNYGLQVFNALGETTYDSNNRHPRILANLYHAKQTSYSYPYPYSFSISGFTSTPWILIGPLTMSVMDVGPETDHYSGIYMSVDSLSSVTVGHQVFGAANDSMTSRYGYSGNSDPYNTRSVSFALADWA